jgi:hypothetical protein
MTGGILGRHAPNVAGQEINDMDSDFHSLRSMSARTMWNGCFGVHERTPEKVAFQQ